MEVATVNAAATAAAVAAGTSAVYTTPPTPRKIPVLVNHHNFSVPPPPLPGYSYIPQGFLPEPVYAGRHDNGDAVQPGVRVRNTFFSYRR